MDNNELEKYRKAWQNEAAFNAGSLTSGKIKQYLNRSLRDTRAYFFKGLVTDISVKSLLLVSLLLMGLIFPFQELPRYVLLFYTLLLIIGVSWQVWVIRRIPKPNGITAPVTAMLSGYLEFYYRFYSRSVFVGALSAPILFMIGSTWYFLIKYQNIPTFQLEDTLVFGTGIILSFGLSLLVQFKFNQFRIRQLEDTLQDAEENTLNEKHFTNQRAELTKSVILFGLLVVVGLAIFALIVISYNT